VNELLTWYHEQARRLPWRGHPDPYAIWVSEIMLQQTQVETVIPYFERWMKRFPTFASLAEASLGEVLSLWEGLGYYSRARNLHKAAQMIVERYAGKLPETAEALRKLPGIGRYTAGAIASIAFGKDEPALDANIRRVLARVFDVNEPARSPQGERRLWELAEIHLPAGRGGDYNQALMDLGALICTPRAPNCPLCPLGEKCEARRLGVQEDRPVLAKKAPVPHYTVTAAVIRRDEQVLITQRPLKGLLGGLWEFPGGKTQPGESLAECLQREICEELATAVLVGNGLGVYKHAYTHFHVTLHAFWCSLPAQHEPRLVEACDLRWVRPEELAQFPMGKIDRLISREVVGCLESDRGGLC
jgi:A/G-specific adenine glycosylase